MNRKIRELRAGWSVSSVLWNVFPDLRIRDQERNPSIGLEVKAIHTAAEEKAANLSTPLNSIRKDGDFLVILLWTWSRVVEEGVAIVYPEVLHSYVFDAYHLARARDYTWLVNQGNRLKGIDIATPVLSPENKRTDSALKAEEGNLGKLMRIGFASTLAAQVPDGGVTLSVIEKYERFQHEALVVGVSQTFKELCLEAAWTLEELRQLQEFPKSATVVGMATDSHHRIYAVCGSLRKSSHAEFRCKLGMRPGDTIVQFGPKLEWRVYQFTDGAFALLASGKKAESCYPQIIKALSA
jgi:hypothetical protein